jgi:regulator of protease activity HflC (stomatin/prohibitin superfamily)
MLSGTGGLVVGVLLGLGVPLLLRALFRAVTVEVEDFETVMVTSFGRLSATLHRPGLHVVAGRWLPWVRLHRVSRQRDFRTVEGIHINDQRGTSVGVDLWLELRVTDPQKALFSVADWDRSLRNVVTHAAISILGGRGFTEILRDRTELGELLRQEVRAETARWGVEIEMLFIRNVRLRPDVARQLFESVAARLERAKADTQEEGRLRVALLEAQTSAQVATLVAEAKGQYPAAIGRAMDAYKRVPEVLEAYQALHALAQLRPHRTVAFQGFGEQELRPVDAAFLQGPATPERPPGPTNGVPQG